MVDYHMRGIEEIIPQQAMTDSKGTKCIHLTAQISPLRCIKNNITPPDNYVARWRNWNHSSPTERLTSDDLHFSLFAGDLISEEGPADAGDFKMLIEVIKKGREGPRRVC